ncbi:hypothetical protein ACFOG5_11470 [Pedobacter fastidiosus]|uniref:DUF4369 domain-containing protein n=1 Tax=Pedobacter fastidiosus TaxID=2765361 RepID=A0ABR7KX03_9SPHI|nr:hypothetical protein [Pedobacter fastidiosus]MBC6112649.1 hypothetical protein [Pedobacter fastidiosus]
MNVINIWVLNLFLIVFGVFTKPIIVIAQDTIIVNTCSVKKKMAFINEKLNSCEDQVYPKFNYFQCIRKSNADTEIRFYSQRGNLGNLRLYQFYKDSIRTIDFRFLFLIDNINHKNLEIPNYKFLGLFKEQRLYVKKVSENLIEEKEEVCRFFSQIVDSEISSVLDGSLLDEDIRSKFPELNQYAEALNYVEFKFQNHFKDLKIPSIIYDSNVENQIPALKKIRNFYAVLKEIDEME